MPPKQTNKKPKAKWDPERLTKLVQLFKKYGRNYAVVASKLPSDWGMDENKVRTAYHNKISKPMKQGKLPISKEDFAAIEKASSAPMVNRKRPVPVPVASSSTVDPKKQREDFATLERNYMAAKEAKDLEEPVHIAESDDDDYEDDDEEDADTGDAPIPVTVEDVKRMVQAAIAEMMIQQPTPVSSFMTPSRGVHELTLRPPEASVEQDYNELEDNQALPQHMRPLRITTNEDLILLFRDYEPGLHFTLEWLRNEQQIIIGWHMQYSVAEWPSKTTVCQKLFEDAQYACANYHLPQSADWSYKELINFNKIIRPTEEQPTLTSVDIVSNSKTHKFIVFSLKVKPTTTVMAKPLLQPFRPFATKAAVASSSIASSSGSGIGSNSNTETSNE